MNTMNFHRTCQYSQMVELTTTLHFSTPSVTFSSFFDCQFRCAQCRRCAPNQSYINPAERCMPLLNIGLERRHAGAFEKIILSCKTMKRLRDKSNEHQGLKETYLASLLKQFPLNLLKQLKN